jgi:toxin ParE1/3/4
MRYELIFSPEAREDLDGIFNYIRQNTGDAVAARYIERIDAYCKSLGDFPVRGSRRDDLLTGMRLVAFERRLSIGFQIVGRNVIFLRFLYGGRQFGSGEN